MAFPTTGVLDNFAYSNGALATVSGGAWSSPVGLDFNVASQVLFPISGAGAIVTYATLGNVSECEAYITVTQLPGSGETAALLWIDGSGNGYTAVYVHGAPGSLGVYRMAGYASTLLGSTVALTLSAGDQLGMWVRPGTNEIEAFSATGGTWTSRATRTDATYTTARRIGLGASGTNVGMDIFGGGAVSPAPPATGGFMTPMRGTWGP